MDAIKSGRVKLGIMTKATLVLGTGRQSNRSSLVVSPAKEMLEARGLEVEIINVADYAAATTAYASENKLFDGWRQAVLSSEAIIFICPEYNHSFPGELKILIDSLYDEYKNKPAFIISTSSGIHGGLRAVEQLKLVLLSVGLQPTNPIISLGKIHESVDLERLEEGLGKIADLVKLLAN